MSTLAPLIVGAALGYSCVQALLLAVAARRGAQVAARAVPFERTCHELRPARRRVLVVGDSTGVGVGAEQGRALAGGFAGPRVRRGLHREPQRERGAPGGRAPSTATSDARSEGAAALQYDLILLQVGGNDVIFGRSLSRTLINADALISASRASAARVIWLGSANVGLSRLFIAPFGRLVTARMRRAHAASRDLAAVHGVTFVDYFREAGCDPYSNRPARFYASDGLHPSGAAYRYCYRLLRRRVPLERWLATTSVVLERTREHGFVEYPPPAIVAMRGREVRNAYVRL